MIFEKLIFTDIDGIPRGKLISNKKYKAKNEIDFCNVVFGWDMHDDLYTKDSITGWFNGFQDGQLTLDKKNQRLLLNDQAARLTICDFSHDPLLKNYCPRSILKSILDQYKALKIVPKIGFEYEWINLKKQQDQLNANIHEPITEGMFGYSLLRLSEYPDFVSGILEKAKKMDIQIEGFHTETGPGVYECALANADALKATDDAVLFKSVVKEEAKRNNILATFMAKYNPNLPGCGAHIHLSLEDEKGNPILDFKPDTPIQGLSEHFVAGILDGLTAMLPIYAPTVNSYKRLQKGTWAPINKSWGIQNRTTALRIINNNPQKSNIELRIPGADVNPYLAVAGALASGLYGLSEKKIINTPICENNAYENTAYESFEKDLKQATLSMLNYKLTNKLLPNAFVQHYAKTRLWEYDKFQQTVTDWETQRYLEIV